MCRGSPYGSEDDTKNCNVVVHEQNVCSLKEIAVGSNEDDLSDVEDDGEDEVPERDIEETTDTFQSRF